jgi:SAM-dependent methyltransferase
VGTRERRLVFGEDADLYDAARPSYPDAVFDEVVDLVGPGGRAIDVGCGTGKALRRLAHHGFSGVGVEAHPAMAGVARRRLPARPPWRVDTSPFEDWQPQPGDAPADVVTCAQAWHWMDPAVRMAKAHGLLRPGGWLAVFWNFSGDENDTPTDRALAAAYAREAPDVAGLPHISDREPDNWPGDTTGLDFGMPLVRDFPWAQAYTTAEWLDLLRTHSNHRVLEPEHLDRLLTAVGEALDDHGGVYLHRYVCRLYAVQRHP